MTMKNTANAGISFFLSLPGFVPTQRYALELMRTRR
jgi:hypothetical protein